MGRFGCKLSAEDPFLSRSSKEPGKPRAHNLEILGRDRHGGGFAGLLGIQGFSQMVFRKAWVFKSSRP